MADERDAPVAALRAELEKVRADSEKRIDGLKKQQAESKTRAKTIIVNQREESRKKIQLLEEDARLRAEELSQLKEMLRQSEAIKSALSEEATVLKNELRASTETIDSLSSENSVTKKELDEMRDALDRSREDAMSERNRLERDLNQTKEQLADSEKELQIVRDSLIVEKSAENSHSPLPTPADSTADIPTDVPADVPADVSADVPADVPADASTEVPAEAPEEALEESSAGPLLTGTATNEETAQNSGELGQLKERSELLSKRLEEAKIDLNACQQKLDKTVDDFKEKEDDLQKRLSKSESRIAELQTELEKCEEALQHEKENVAKAKATPSESAATSDESKKVLEAKVAEMERLVVSKQAEIGKVREKARTYLKELNAEKRTLEEKRKEEVDALQKKVDDEREKVIVAEQKAESAAKEMDNCLAVIREKQKSVQMLKMTVSTHKNAAEEAKRETENIRTEFSRYKERARLALQERENVASASEADIESATALIRTDLERARKETKDLKKRISEIRGAEQIVDELRERTERAEAVAELLRKDATGMETTNYSQVDRLEGKVAKLEAELSAARSGIEDAEARHSTTKMRLDGAQKALRSTELRAKDTEVIFQKARDSLLARIGELEGDLKKAQEAAAAAQRTASAAAKALTLSSVTDPDEMDSAGKRKAKLQGGEHTGYNLDMEVNGNRSSLAVAIEGHTDRLGLSPRRERELQTSESGGGSGTTEADLQAKEQQIAVLTSQLAELGALFDEVQQESQLRSEQTDVLKAEVKNLDAKLVSAEKLQNGAPFNYLRTIVVRYLETDDATLLPVICNVLSFSDEETTRVKAQRASKGTGSSSGLSSSKSGGGGYFSLPFLGSR